MRSSHIFWCTGLSGSGKTTLSELACSTMQKEGLKVKIIDGDDVRDRYVKPLGFSKEDILINNDLIAKTAKEAMGLFDIIIVPVISPFKEARDCAKSTIGSENFSLIYFSANLETVSNRDVKGLYEKARQGIIKDMIGFNESSPFEAPKEYGLRIDSGNENKDESLSKMISFINNTINLKKENL